ncbi:uncharacterized protein LOC114301364 [Camellia sinensis]|uniref:uncharacterized protein LOC114301364 n=1 Tax=Camellia sinensis TaxID=4442 RepID=UPI001036CD6C|nr:uncharacterized protein LOC114301364 [Camellia sinensis]
MARECYVTSLNEVKMKEAMIIKGLDVRDEEELVRGEPVEELVEVPIDLSDSAKTARICSQLSSQAKADLIALLAEHSDVFAWTHSNMPVITGQAVTDFILEFTNLTPNVPPPQPHFTTDEENPHSWTLSVDGSSCKEGSAAGLILTTPKGEYFKCALRFLFDASNNETKYEALIAGFRMARDIGVNHIQVFGDSQLIVGQIIGEFDAKEEMMRAYRDIAFHLVRCFNTFQIRHIPRSENSKADEIAQLASADQSDFSHGIRIEYLTHSATSANPQEIQFLQNEPIPWAQDTIPFLTQRELPDDKQCLSPAQVTYVIRELHEGICGNHSGGRSLAHKILRIGYFWPTFNQDANEFVLKCDKCQRFANIPHAPPTELITLSSLYHFAKWGIDIVGLLPTGRGQTMFVVVVIDYFTKWVEAKPLATITERNTTRFIWQSIVCRFGIPQAIVSDNEKQFDNAKFRKFCEDLNIRPCFSSLGHSQANG